MLNLFYFISVILFSTPSFAQVISSCASYGCKPSGTFSFTLNPPKNASVAWTTDFFIGPVPNGLGCVGNPNNIVCQSNGPHEVGYVSIDVATGKLVWRDGILRFPVLPAMDEFGDIYGSDGHDLVYYDDSGKMSPVIRMSDWVFPIYSLLMTDNDILMFVSRNGYMISYYTDGSPHANIPFSAEIERVNGTFIPVSTPVISGHRAYVLTQFKPMDPTAQLGLQRLYAVDIIPRMVDRLHVVWTVDFEREITEKVSLTNHDPNVEFFEQEETDHHFQVSEQIYQVMVNTDNNMVYVNLPPPTRGSNAMNQFWGIKDKVSNTEPEVMFKFHYALSSMALYEQDNILNTKTKQGSADHLMSQNLGNTNHGESLPSESVVWALSSNREIIVEISPYNGTILGSLNISKTIQSRAQVSSDIMVTRADPTSKDTLIFAITLISEPTRKFIDLVKAMNNARSQNRNYIIQLENGKVKWMVPTVKDLPGVGQIAGIRNTGIRNDLKDLLVVFAGDDESSVIFGITNN